MKVPEKKKCVFIILCVCVHAHQLHVIKKKQNSDLKMNLLMLLSHPKVPKNSVLFFFFAFL